MQIIARCAPSIGPQPIKQKQQKGFTMFALKISKNRYKFINLDVDKLKIKAFNLTGVALAIYGLYSIVIK
jgi:hypothetical protein